MSDDPISIEQGLRQTITDVTRHVAALIKRMEEQDMRIALLTARVELINRRHECPGNQEKAAIRLVDQR